MTSPSTTASRPPRSRKRTSPKQPAPPAETPAAPAETLESPLFIPPAETGQDPGPEPSWSSPSPDASGPELVSPSGIRSTPGEPDRPAPPRRIGRRQILKPIAGVVQLFGGVLNAVLTAPATVEREAGLWIPDDEDTVALADPLAGMAARRLPASVAGHDAGDVGDVLALVVGVLGYVGKQLARRAELRVTAEQLPDPDDWSRLSAEEAAIRLQQQEAGA